MLLAVCAMFSIFRRSCTSKCINSPSSRWEFAPRWISTHGNTYQNKKNRVKDLVVRILGISILSQSATDVIEKWVCEGNYINVSHLKFLSKELEKSNRLKNAYEISEWMVRNHRFELLDGDHAYHICLTNKAMGIDAAGCYFEGLPVTAKSFRTYAAIIHCYALLNLTEKAEKLYNTARDSCLRLQPRAYLEMMSLYISDGQFEKVPLVIRDMKCQRFEIDLLIYNSWISSCAATLNINGIQRILDEMSCVCEEQEEENKAWVMYMKLVKVYISTDLLVNSEADPFGWKISYDFLIILYAGLGNIAYVDEIWRSLGMMQKKMRGRNFVSIVSSYVVLGKMKEAGEVIYQWKQSSGTDMSVCKRLLNSFLIIGLAEEGDAFKRLLINRGYDPALI